LLLMFANYHTHTYRCHHANGTEREYIEKAIASGIKILGFSDHIPYYFPKGFYSSFRMKFEEVQGYIETLQNLRNEYIKDIQIFIGFECEYYPDYFEQTIKKLSEYEYDYLILGQHFIENEISCIASGSPTKDENILQIYVDQTIEAMKTRKFTYFAHPDIINYTGNLDTYTKHMKRLCMCANELDIPLEINFLGISDRRNYPCDKFFSIASEVGNKIIFGCDAHNSFAIGDSATLSEAEKFAERHKLNVIDKLLNNFD